MEYYAGIDVSLEWSSVCLVDGSGKIIREDKVASEVEGLIGWFARLGLEVTRIGLRPVRCHSGCTQRCGIVDCQWSCLRPGMFATPLRRCR